MAGLLSDNECPGAEQCNKVRGYEGNRECCEWCESKPTESQDEIYYRWLTARYFDIKEFKLHPIDDLGLDPGDLEAMRIIIATTRFEQHKQQQEQMDRIKRR